MFGSLGVGGGTPPVRIVDVATIRFRQWRSYLQSPATLKFVDASQVVDGPPLSFEETRETIRVAISLGGPSVNDMYLSNIQLRAIISLLPLRGP